MMSLVQQYFDRFLASSSSMFLDLFGGGNLAWNQLNCTVKENHMEHSIDQMSERFKITRPTIGDEAFLWVREERLVEKHDV
jgi:hypothetical protein